jgi:hypothetical protein
MFRFAISDNDDDDDDDGFITNSCHADTHINDDDDGHGDVVDLNEQVQPEFAIVIVFVVLSLLCVCRLF